MKALDELGGKELRELLGRNWMTHDAMWFRHTTARFGIEAANEVNIAAVRSMAEVEIRRFLRLLGVEAIRSFADLRALLEAMTPLVKMDFMKFEVSYPGGNTLRWEWAPGDCFAYRGVAAAGLADRYRCGIFARPEAWFDALGLSYAVTPKVSGCMMHAEGRCYREYVFSFPP